jgi:hypothetical protein
MLNNRSPQFTSLCLMSGSRCLHLFPGNISYSRSDIIFLSRNYPSGLACVSAFAQSVNPCRWMILRITEQDKGAARQCCHRTNFSCGRQNRSYRTKWPFFDDVATEGVFLIFPFCFPYISMLLLASLPILDVQTHFYMKSFQNIIRDNGVHLRIEKLDSKRCPFTCIYVCDWRIN